MKVTAANSVGWSGLMRACLIDLPENGKLIGKRQFTRVTQC